MSRSPPNLPSTTMIDVDFSDEGDLSDMLSELRILLPSAQMLTAFLIILPFNGGARTLLLAERSAFLITFFFALASLVLLSAPAIQHRLMRPLANRARFKLLASREIVAGSIAQACAFTIGTYLVISGVFGSVIGISASTTMAGLIAALWWALPVHLKRKHGF